MAGKKTTAKANKQKTKVEVDISEQEQEILENEQALADFSFTSGGVDEEQLQQTDNLVEKLKRMNEKYKKENYSIKKWDGVPCVFSFIVEKIGSNQRPDMNNPSIMRDVMYWKGIRLDEQGKPERIIFFEQPSLKTQMLNQNVQVGDSVFINYQGKKPHPDEQKAKMNYTFHSFFVKKEES